MEVKIDISSAPGAVAAILSGVEAARREILDAAAAGVRNALLEHFMARQREPRADGFTPKGFWYSNKAGSVAGQVRDPEPAPDGRSAAVRIESPALAHKVTGGEVRPRGGRRYLAIPATDAASLYDGSPRDNPALAPKPFGLAAHPGGGSRPALLDASGSPLYWLVRKALHKPDPRALPGDGALLDAALAAIE